MRTNRINALAALLFASACSSAELEPVAQTEQALCRYIPCSGTLRHCDHDDQHGVQMCLANGDWTDCGYGLDFWDYCTPGATRACWMDGNAKHMSGSQSCSIYGLWYPCSCAPTGHIG